MQEHLNRITFSDAFAFLTKLSANSVDSTVTSPPGWRKRRQLPADHKLCRFEMGQESNLHDYIGGMFDVFSKVYAATKPHGSCWVHLPDTRITHDMIAKGSETKNGYFPGEVVDLPWHFASMMRLIGWRHTSTIVWHKTNANHFAAYHRPSDAHDYILVFAKSELPYFDWFAAQEDADGPKGAPALRRCRDVWTYATESVNGQRLIGDQIDTGEFVEIEASCPVHGEGQDGGVGPLFRMNDGFTCSCKSVARESLQATPGAIVARCIAASTSQEGNCPECGKGYVRKVKKVDRTRDPKIGAMVEVSGGFESDCSCIIGEPTRKPVVLDPFAGSGTTLMAATMLGRDFLGSELDPRFVSKVIPARLSKGVLSCGRLTKPPLPLP